MSAGAGAKPVAEIRKNGMTVVRVALSRYQGRDRLDVREFVDVDRSGEHRPTRKGVNLAVQDLPALRAALEAAERDALSRGLLEAEDYTEAGLSPPPELLESAE